MRNCLHNNLQKVKIVKFLLTANCDYNVYIIRNTLVS
jgi:hypothetical protein